MPHRSPLHLNDLRLVNTRSMTGLSSSASAQRGVALLTILLLVVSITVVAGAMLASQKVAIRQSGLLFEQDQLLQDINAGQQLAVALITADSKLNDTDSSQDIWAQPIPPYPIGTHVLSIKIADEASRFNINNLYHDGQVDTAALAAFKRLLAQLNLPETIATAVLDWQDPDDKVYEDSGSESVVYAQGNVSSRATAKVSLPNQPFVSVEQLSEVSGVTADVLATLRPYLSAVPYYVPINVNTADPQVLAALVEAGSGEQMQALISSRQSQPIASLDELWQLPPFNGLDEKARNAASPLLSVESAAFSALITAAEAASSSNQAPRQRYATVLISKLSDENSSSQQASGSEANKPATDNNAQGNTSQAKTIKAFSQRLWPYRPSY